ncbi:lipopolysaccharide biosynthesis protein [Hathewaya histolytica]|uniref:lipopolysaccharide biosynthesis protein n=1 Tax=Hathewaya histolytica TaxID=1498 RepID=UPI003B670A1A
MSIKGIFNRAFKLDFLKHGFNYIIANFFSKGLVFLMIPVFTRILTPSEYGTYSIYVTIVSIFSILISLNIPAAIKQSYLKRENEFSAILGTNLIFIVLTTLPIAIVYFIFSNEISDFFKVPAKVFKLSIVVCIFLMFYNMYIYYLEAKQESFKFLKISCSNKIIETSICVSFLFFISSNKYYSAIYGQIIAISIFAVICLYKLIKIADFKFDLGYLKYSLAYSIPLIPHNLSNLILAQFDKIILNQILGAHSTGVYSFAYNISMIITVIINSLNSSWVPIFFENYRNKKYLYLQDLAKKFFKIICLCCTIIILFSKEITMVVSTEQYYKGINIIPIIILGNLMIFFYVLYANYAFYYNNTYMISINTFIAGTINIILNYIFIPKWGYLAAAYTTLFSYIVLFLLHYINSKYILKAKVIPLSTFKFDLTKFVSVISVYFIITHIIDNTIILIMIKSVIIAVLIVIEIHKQIIFI